MKFNAKAKVAAISRTQSQAIAGALTFVLLLVGVLANNLHSFGLSDRAITIIAVLVPIIDQCLTWLIHGLATGDWSVLPPQPAPIVNPAPAPPAPVPPAA